MPINRKDKPVAQPVAIALAVTIVILVVVSRRRRRMVVPYALIGLAFSAVALGSG